MKLIGKIKQERLDKFEYLVTTNDIGEAAEYYYKFAFMYQPEFNVILKALGKYDIVMDQLDIITGDYDPSPPQV
jgi:hypothetical protein